MPLGSNASAAGANSQGPQCPSTMGTPWAADEHMHPGVHKTVDSECVDGPLRRIPRYGLHHRGKEDLRTVHNSCSRIKHL